MAFLLGDIVADGLGDSMAFLLGDIVADGLGDSPGGVNALGLWDLGAPWAGHQAGLLDWPLVADTPDLGLTPWGSMGNGCNSASNDLGISISLSLTLAKTKSPHSTESSKSSITRGSNSSSSSNCSTPNGSTNNRLNCNLALNSNQSSLGT